MREETGGELWFALQVRSLHERTVADMLRFKGYEEFVPVYQRKRRWSDRTKEVKLPLFPGYVFCRFDLRFRMPILTTPGVHSVIGAGREPIPVAEAEIEAVKRIVQSGLGAEPWPYLSAGDRVQIQEGPLCGLDGILLQIKRRNHLVVSVTLLNRSVAVDIDSSAVIPADVARILKAPRPLRVVGDPASVYSRTC